jgi:integrase
LVGDGRRGLASSADKQEPQPLQHRKTPPVSCPECDSTRLYRDGLRYIGAGPVQRWLCRDCGYRFSKNGSDRLNAKFKNLKGRRDKEGAVQVCAQKDAKNLTSATETKTVAGDRKKTWRRNLDVISEDARGLITQFMAYLEREGFCADIQYPQTLGHLAKDGADLLDPENVKTVIAKQRKRNGEPWSDSMKMLAVYAYDAFCRMQDIKWKRPVYRQNEATVAVPDEKDLDLLISGARRKLATFLLALKETFADPSEVLRAEWVDLAGDVFSINHPVKGHLPGKYQLSRRLVAMLNALPRKDKRIFPTTYKNIYSSLENLRSKAAEKFQNPALKQISFKSFRHWGGSMLAYMTNGNVPVMARILRHKSWRSTQKYVHTIEFKDEDFDTAVATTAEEIQQLGKAGWTKYDEETFNGVTMHFYRKPRRFGGLKRMDDKTEKRVDRFLCTA